MILTGSQNVTYLVILGSDPGFLYNPFFPTFWGGLFSDPLFDHFWPPFVTFGQNDNTHNLNVKSHGFWPQMIKMVISTPTWDKGSKRGPPFWPPLICNPSNSCSRGWNHFLHGFHGFWAPRPYFDPYLTTFDHLWSLWVKMTIPIIWTADNMVFGPKWSKWPLYVTLEITGF